MTMAKLSQKFVSNWLLGTAVFVMSWSIYLSYTVGVVWSFVGLMGGMAMLHLHAETEGKRVLSPWVFWTIVISLLVVDLNMALASLGICKDAFGLLG